MSDKAKPGGAKRVAARALDALLSSALALAVAPLLLLLAGAALAMRIGDWIELYAHFDGDAAAQERARGRWC